MTMSNKKYTTIYLNICKIPIAKTVCRNKLSKSASIIALKSGPSVSTGGRIHPTFDCTPWKPRGEIVGSPLEFPSWWAATTLGSQEFQDGGQPRFRLWCGISLSLSHITVLLCCPYRPMPRRRLPSFLPQRLYTSNRGWSYYYARFSLELCAIENFRIY